MNQSLTIPENATDALVIEMWLHNRPTHTQTAYRVDIAALLAFTGKSLQAVTLLDLQNFSDSLAGLQLTSINRKLSAVKSLFTFAHKSGYVSVNVGAALRLGKTQERLAERIMSETQMQRMLALEEDKRNHAMLRLMYNAGLRVSEVVSLTWKDVQENKSGGQIRVFGKGGKERYIVISTETYQEMLALRESAPDTAPVFQSRKAAKEHFLSRFRVYHIVEEAAIRANIAIYEKDGITRSKVSPHWIRHAHASHAIERQAPVTLVRDTLGHSNIATTNKYSHAKPEESSGKYLPI